MDLKENLSVMEDIQRLALIEQSIANAETFVKVLNLLLVQINNMLENPDDQEARIIKVEGLKSYFTHSALTDYIKYLGFRQVGDDYVYPKDLPLNSLRMAQASLLRKIYFCSGSPWNKRVNKTGIVFTKPVVPKLLPCRVVKSDNFLLKEIERIFNHMLVYEEDCLLELAREQVPVVMLQLLALDRMRGQQRAIKDGTSTEPDLPFDMALLMELMLWFKDKFFKWVNKPDCERCGAKTVLTHTAMEHVEGERCNVEHYRCVQCSGTTKFARHNCPRRLLVTRRGRCGEWANCFALLARSLGYDTRYVYDTTDHVWCEVYDYNTGQWLHLDPCEGKLNAPLMYSHGWNKSLSYIIAVSKDDLQDVTWRYTTDHKEVLKRRTIVSEDQLISTIMALREDRQRHVTEARRKFLAKRCLQELVQLMVEKTPNEAELNGRISGSREWREMRGEIRTYKNAFHFQNSGQFEIQYCCATDKYVEEQNGERNEVVGWQAYVWDCSKMFRKVEKDWHMVYLAREEGSSEGMISWKIETKEGLKLTVLTISVCTATYETGSIQWTLTFDNERPLPVKLSESPTSFTNRCTSALLTCTTKGGNGVNAWQHSQLFRQKDDSTDPMFKLSVTIEKEC